MNQLLYQRKENSLSSRLTLRSNVRRAVVAVALLVLVPAAAFAQYPGGGGTGAAGSYPSYGSKGKVIGAAVAGTAVGAGLLYWKLHNRAKVQGCVAANGDKLVTEKDNHTYNLTNKQHETLQPGERVELVGKKTKDSSGEPLFEVHKLSKSLGQCTTTTAEQRQ
jgi:hypothetical protein